MVVLDRLMPSPVVYCSVITVCLLLESGVDFESGAKGFVSVFELVCVGKTSYLFLTSFSFFLFSFIA